MKRIKNNNLVYDELTVFFRNSFYEIKKEIQLAFDKNIENELPFKFENYVKKKVSLQRFCRYEEKQKTEIFIQWIKEILIKNIDQFLNRRIENKELKFPNFKIKYHKISTDENGNEVFLGIPRYKK